MALGFSSGHSPDTTVLLQSTLHRRTKLSDLLRICRGPLAALEEADEYWYPDGTALVVVTKSVPRRLFA